MRKKAIVTLAALVLALALAGGALAATPYLGQGEGLRMGRTFGGLAARVASFMGIELQQVVDSRLAGQSLADILGDDLDEFVAATVAEREALVAELLRDGKITAEQAALCAGFSAERLQERLQSTFVGCGNGGPLGGAGRFVQNMRGRMLRFRQQ